jgi:hypothetical protein
VMILDVATGHSTDVGEGMDPSWPSELELMAELAGLRLRERWGDGGTNPSSPPIGASWYSNRREPEATTHVPSRPLGSDLRTRRSQGTAGDRGTGRSTRVDEKLTEQRDEASVNGIEGTQETGAELRFLGHKACDQRVRTTFRFA